MSAEEQSVLQRAEELLDQDMPDKARDLLQEHVSIHGPTIKTQRMLGYVLLQQRHADEAVAAFEELLRLSNQSPVARLDLAKALSQAGDLPRAAEILKSAVDEVATLSPAWYLLGDVFVEQRKFAEARHAYEQAEANDPFRLQIDQCKRSVRENDLAKVERILTHILEQDDLHVEALAGMEVLAMANDDWIEAERLFTRMRQRTRYWPTMLLGQAQLFLMTNRTQEALETLNTLVEIYPTQTLGWNMLGTANELLMQHGEAISAFRKSLELEPYQPMPLVSIGNIQRVIGERAASEQSFTSALRFRGMNGEAYWGLSNLKNYEFSDQQLADMQSALRDDSESLHNAAPLHFALARAFEDRGDFDKAFAHFVQGNQIQKLYSDFSSEVYHDDIDRICRAFVEPVIQRLARPQIPGENPIFIVGLPRTGSTLVEQVLASHPDVDATMELPFIPQFVREFQAREKTIGPFPESIDQFTNADLDNLAERYLSSAAIYRKGAKRFIDKMPNNFVHIGLIHMLFPNAVFVDVARHPLDTCVSVFRQRFAIGQSFSYSLDDIAQYYLGYRRLMAHWESLLPGRIHRLTYERFVTQPDVEIPALLESCGLAFEEACLSPEKTQRPIRTPSSEQVRQPITASRIGYWENFRDGLGDLPNILAEPIAEHEARLVDH